MPAVYNPADIVLCIHSGRDPILDCVCWNVSGMRLGVDASSNQPTLEIIGKTCTLPVRNRVLMSLQEGLWPQNSPFFKF